jgi:hypothetical protein
MRVAAFLRSMATPTETNPSQLDSDQLARLLEMELMQKRASWKKTIARNRSIRAFGFLFLFILIMASLVGGYFVFLRISDSRSNQTPSSAVQR